jgi:phosphatidylglycerol---prolipoprotein diacylglyceryl transferase
MAPIVPSSIVACVFPYYLVLGNRRVHPHVAFEALAYAIAFCIFFYLRRRFEDPLAPPIRWAVVAVAIAAAALGSKVLYWLEDPELSLRNLHNAAYLLGGKTMVGALTFGIAGVELMKRYIGVNQSTGDLYAIPLALGIAVGRVGCFLTGLSDNTYGVAAHLPWSVDFGDGVHRHPTQIYEIVFLLAIVPILYRILRSIPPGASGHPAARARFQPGDAFKFFMVSYLSFRFFCDFLKPYPPFFLGIESIQWACLMGLLYYSPDVLRWSRGPSSVAASAH